MIKDIAQPIFGSVILLVLSIYLLRLRAWLTSVLLVLGFFVIFLAVLDDQAAEKEIISTHLPALLLNVLNHISEEQFDLWGISLIFLSSLVFFRAPLLDLFKRGAVCVVSLCFFSLALTVGNGLMHHQYNPSNKLHFVACLISLTGLSGLVFLNKSGKAKDAIFRLVTEDIFYIFVGLFFILIPSIHGRVRASVAILIWIPITIVMARYLWKYHRANHTKTTRSASDAYG